jgi:glycosyltransferase involved in cell wall biosynthesis
LSELVDCHRIIHQIIEGLPYVLVEAVVLAKPIVATDIDGVREVIRNGETGLLVPAEDPHSLSLAVNLLLGDPAFGRRLAGRARAQIPKNFTIKRMVDETERFYLKLAAMGESPRPAGAAR